MHSNGSVLKPLSKPPTAPPLGPVQGGGGVGSGGASIGSGSNSTVSLAHRAIESFNNKVQSLSTKLPKKAWQDDVTSDDDGELHCDCERRSIIDACCPLSTLHLDWGRKKSDSYSSQAGNSRVGLATLTKHQHEVVDTFEYEE